MCSAMLRYVYRSLASCAAMPRHVLRSLDVSSGGALPTHRLAELRENLKPQLPRSNSVRMCISNMMEGRVQGKFYTEAWPHFTTVVFQCLEPRLSDTADLLCYSTSRQDLLNVLKQNELVTAGKWQMIQIIEDDNKTIGDYLIRNLMVDGQALSSQDYTTVTLGMHGILGELISPSVPCPEGYFLGPLTEQHNLLAIAHGQWFNNVGRPAEIVQNYHKQCVQRLDTTAAYHNEDPTTPVSWIIQWANDSTIGNAYTEEAHRRKGLAEALLAQRCKRILSKGDIPEGRILEHNFGSINLVHKIGSSLFGKATVMFLHWNTCSHT